MQIYSLSIKPIQDNTDNPKLFFRNLSKLNSYLKSENIEIVLDELKASNLVSNIEGMVIYENDLISINAYQI